MNNAQLDALFREAVQVLVEAGADLNRRDTAYDATPHGWAKYGEQQQNEKSRSETQEAEAHPGRAAKGYQAIAAYLQSKGGQ